MIIMIALCRVMLFFARPNFSAKNHRRSRTIRWNYYRLSIFYFIGQIFQRYFSCKISSDIFLQNAIKWKRNDMHDCNISFSNYNFYYKKKKNINWTVLCYEKSFSLSALSWWKNIKILKISNWDEISFTNFANRLYVNRFISAELKLSLHRRDVMLNLLAHIPIRQKHF